jgi:hypothetical protein
MSSSLPVPAPSKAAICALRGLALGTSCALAVIVEDRRRRISVLRTAVGNKKKIRSLKQYHGTSDAAAALIDDAVVIPPEELHWEYHGEAPKASRLDQCSTHLTPTSHRLPPHPFQPPHAAAGDETPIEQRTASEVNEQQNPSDRSAPASKRPFDGAIYPTPRLQSTLQLSNPRDRGGWSFSPNIQAVPKPREIIDQISGLSVSAINDLLQDSTALSKYTAAFTATCGVKVAFKKKLDDTWLNVSEALCRQCQAVGQWQEAQDVLLAVIKSGELSEDQFYAHDPIPVLESILSVVDNGSTDLAAKNLGAAAQIFLAKFVDKPKTHSDEILDLGKRLISQLLKHHQDRLVDQIYWRVLTQQESPEQFVAWCIQALFNNQDYKSVIKYFKLNFTKLSPDNTCFEEIVPLVTRSVEEMRGVQAEQVLRYLAKQCDATSLIPKPTWLVNVLQAHWSRHKDLNKSEELFKEVATLGLLDKMGKPGRVYQIMVKLSVLAGDNLAAQRYYQDTMTLAPSMASDVWLNGYMTLMKAKAGDWDGVLSDFTRMQPCAKSQPEAYGQTFVAVLKVFMEDHPMSDVEDFIKLYVNEMDVPLHRYVVTLVANMYGELRDHAAFLQWIQYCNSEGFALDPAFSNALLRNCRLKWKFPYPVLRKLYSEMRRMQPTSVDTVTVRIMHNAAVSDGSSARKSVQQRVRMLGGSVSNLPRYGKSANERDVLHIMTEELARGHSFKAVTVYRRALRLGMPWCPNCFRTAVKAALQVNSNSSSLAIRLISEAHEQGRDVTLAVAIFLKAQIDTYRGPFEQVMAHLKTLVSRFESTGMLIDSSVLTHVAIISAKFRRFDKAIDLCKLAMEKGGTTNPCFSRQSFRVLLMSFWQTLDVEGMRWLVQSLPSSTLAEDNKAYQLLKSTKRHMKKWKESPRALEITQILQDGIDQAKKQKAAQIEVGSAIYNETLRILGKAVADLEASGKGNRSENDTPREPRMLEPEHQVSVSACG